MQLRLLGRSSSLSPADHPVFVYRVSLLYLEGDCIEDRDDNSGADCSREGGTANATSCTDVFTRGETVSTLKCSSCMILLGCLELVYAHAVASSDNFRSVSSIESSSLEFTSGLVCNSNASTAYIFVNTTCASFNPSWILVSLLLLCPVPCCMNSALGCSLVASANQAAYTNFMSLVTQLNPVEDPDDCRSIKAYNYGAAIGIIVAVIVVLALLIGGWIYWYRRSSRQVSRT